MSYETINFGSEFFAMKQATEYTCGLRCKLRMFGIPVTEPAFVHGDNQSVFCNTPAPQSTIDFHFVKEKRAQDECRTAYINTYLNVVNLMTKPLAGIKRWKSVQMLQHYIFPAAAA